MICNVLDFGAVADGKTLCTDAFAKAVAECAKTGGYVDVPAGEYVTGTIVLKSNVYLRFEPGAVLLASKYFEDFIGTKRGCSWGSAPGRLVKGKYIKGKKETNTCNPCASVIMAEDEENCGLVGPGTVNGRRGGDYIGTENWEKAGNVFLCVFSNCKNVSIKDVTFKNPGSFNVYTLNCENVFYDGVKIYSRKCACGDGLDFDGSKNVLISNCFIDAGDDAIGLKTLTPSEPCENFTITNCTISSVWAAVRIGPETGSDFRNINISNCVFNKCNDGFKLQLCEDRVFEDFVFSNISMIDVMRPVFMTLNTYVMSMHNKSVRPPVGTFRRIRFSNINAKMIQKVYENSEGQLSGNFMYAMEGSKIEDVTFSGVTFIAEGGYEKEEPCVKKELLADYTDKYPEAIYNMGQYPSAVFYVRNAKNVLFTDCSFVATKKDARPAVVADNVENMRLCGCRADQTNGLLKKIICENVKVTDSIGLVKESSREELLQRAFYMNEAEKLLSAYAKYAKIADKAVSGRKLGEYRIGDEAEIRFDETKKYYIVMSNVGADFSLYVNGDRCENFNLPDEDKAPTCFAAEITKYVQNGFNSFDFDVEKGKKIPGTVTFVIFER